MSERTEIIEFTVEGHWPFPTDMLRFDECWPVDVESANAIAGSAEDGRLTVRLRTRQTLASSRPTVGRWASFTWRVVDGSDRFAGLDAAIARAGEKL